jgi:predicted transposase YbfD/YdcC
MVESARLLGQTENHLHWSLDMSFNEDHSRAHLRNAWL